MCRFQVFRVLLGLYMPVALSCTRHGVRLDPGPLVTDRPDFSESPTTVVPGFSLVEGGSTYSRERGEHSVSIGEALVRVGLQEHLELRITPASYILQRGDRMRMRGFEDASVGLKIQLRDSPDSSTLSDPAVAIIVATSVPTGTEVLRSRQPLPEVKLALGWALSNRVSASSNLGWTRGESGNASFSEWSGSASLGVAASERVGSYFEYFTISKQLPVWQHRSYVNSGLTYLVNEALQLDARFGFRTNGPGVFGGLGFAKRF